MNALDAIDAGKLRVQKKMPYFVDVLFRIRPVAKPGLGTFGIDANLRLWYDPAVVEQWFESGAECMPRPVLHEIEHWLRNHFVRRGDRQPFKWNCSSDAEINGDHEALAEKLGWKWPKGLTPVLPSAWNLKPGLTAEEYYELIPEQKQESGGTVGGGACGGCAGNPGSHETPEANGMPPVSLDEAEIIRERVAQRVVAAVRNGTGNVPLGLRRWAEERLAPPKVDYRRLLAKIVRGTVNSVAGAFDYTRSRIGRRYFGTRAVLGPLAVIPPALKRPLPKVTIVRDTSGSMGFGKDSPLERASAEVLGIAKAAGADAILFDVDTVAIRSRVRTEADVRKTCGGGGTDMRTGILEAAKEKPDIIFVASDGDTPWPSPEEMPRCKVVVVLIGAQAPTPPDYIKFVRIE